MNKQILQRCHQSTVNTLGRKTDMEKNTYYESLSE